jgi:hypothetical protein
MNLKFSIVAEREIAAAADYYESQEAGLGLRFVEDLNHATAFILQFPACLVADFKAIPPLLATTLSLPCPLFRTRRYRNDRNRGSSAS